MVQDRSQEPITDTELDSAYKGIEEFCTETEKILAEGLDGDAEDYRADRYRKFEADGGDQ